MRKLTAILFICIYCFNLFGYIILFHYLEQDAYVKAEESIDREAYSSADLVEVKIPYALPYAFTSNEYERANGFVNVNGVQYNYVKKKLSHDTLYMYCLPNERQSKLLNGEHNYSSLVNGVSDKEDTQKPGNATNNFQQIFFATYHQPHPDYNLSTFSALLQIAHRSAEPALSSCFIRTAHEPPKA